MAPSPVGTEVAPAERSQWVLRWDTQEEPQPRAPRLKPWPAGSVATFPGGGWAAFEGHLFDRPSLAEALGLPRDSSEATLVGTAFQRWGAAALDRLRGTWFLAVWDPGPGTLHVSRDAMGIHPVQYRWDGRTLHVACAIEALLRLPEIPFRVRRQAVAELLMLRFPPPHLGETFFEGIDRLPAAHRLEVRRGSLRFQRWWDPLPEGFSWAGPDEIASFEDVFGRAVERVLDAGADSIALSGGFDSVSIAAVAAHRRPQGPRLRAVSLRFLGESCDEAETQVQVADLLGMPRTMVTLGQGFEREDLLDAALEQPYFSPLPILGIWNSLYTKLFEAARAEGCGSMIFGTGGDEMLVVDLSHAADCVRRLQLVRLWRFLRAAQRTSPFTRFQVTRLVLWTSALRPLLRAAGARVVGAASPRLLRAHRRRRLRRGIPDWISDDPELVRALEERSGLDRPRDRGPDAAYVRRMRHLTQAPLLHLEFDQAFAWSRHLGLRSLYPFFDTDMVGLSLRLHPQDLISGGRFKSPLRRLVARRLPEARMPVRKVDFTHLVHSIQRTSGPDTWRRFGGAPALAALGVVSPLSLERMLAQYWEARTEDSFRPWLVLSTERWLRRVSTWASTDRRDHADAR